MADAHEADGLDGPSEPRQPSSRPGLPRPPRVMLFGATALVSSMALYQAPALWDELQGLRGDWERTRQSSPIGYVEISPVPSYAQPPRPWIVEQGESTLLWSGWVHGSGHTWFRFRRGEIDPLRLTDPLGRDTVRAIDKAVVELGGGEIWDRLPPDTPVIGVRFHGRPTVYPLLVLTKVEVVNDTIDDRPILTVCTPFVPEEEAVDFYDPRLGGTRIRLASSGYFLDPQSPRPLFYDRDTESFWVVRDHAIVCIAGERKGSELTHLGRGRPTTWGAWTARYPQSRLVIGADRGQDLGNEPPAPSPEPHDTR